MKFKKKRNGEAITVVHNVEGRVVTECPQVQANGYVKAWDLDIIMEESESMMKKSCMETDVEPSLNELIAEIGQPQPRKQQ